jgi:hypothetical protein
MLLIDKEDKTSPQRGTELVNLKRLVLEAFSGTSSIPQPTHVIEKIISSPVSPGFHCYNVNVRAKYIWTVTKQFVPCPNSGNFFYCKQEPSPHGSPPSSLLIYQRLKPWLGHLLLTLLTREGQLLSGNGDAQKYTDESDSLLTTYTHVLAQGYTTHHADPYKGRIWKHSE